MTNTPKECCGSCYGRMGTLAGGGTYCSDATCPCHTPKEATDEGLEAIVDEYFVVTKMHPSIDKRKQMIGVLSSVFSRSHTAGYAAGQREERERIISKLDRLYVEELQKYPECTWNSAIDEVKGIVRNPQSHE